MASAEISFPGPGADSGCVAGDADADVDPGGPSDTADVSEACRVGAESSPHSPSTSSAPKKIGFSISSILDDDDEKPAVRDLDGDRDLRPADGASSTGTAHQPSMSVSQSEPDQLTTYFYRDQLNLCSQKTQSTADQAGGCSADAVIRSWTMPPTSPLIYRESVFLFHSLYGPAHYNGSLLIAHTHGRMAKLSWPGNYENNLKLNKNHWSL